jgi:large subunit ribosomal protein L13
MRTFSAKSSGIDRKWYIVDAKDRPLGRVAVTVANLLRGKGKTI